MIESENPAPPQAEEMAYVVKAVLTVHQDFAVKGRDPEHSKQRLRRYLADPEMIAPGIVKHEGDSTIVRWLIREEKKPKK